MSTAELSGTGASPWEQRLHSHLRQHVQTEGAMLTRYAEVAAQSGSKAFRYLVELLLEDERRHHRLFDQLANSLETAALMRPQEPDIPDLDFHRADGAAVLLAAKELLANEEEDLRELKALERELRDVKNTSLWSLLVDLMQRDTEKHIAILKFVCKQL